MLAIDNLANRDEITPQLLLLTHTPSGEFHCVQMTIVGRVVDSYC